MNNLPLSDRAGRGALEQRIQSIVRDMSRYAETDRYEFERLSKQLDACRSQFHKLYNVKEHPVEAPLREVHG